MKSSVIIVLAELLLDTQSVEIPACAAFAPFNTAVLDVFKECSDSRFVILHQGLDVAERVLKNRLAQQGVCNVGMLAVKSNCLEDYQAVLQLLRKRYTVHTYLTQEVNPLLAQLGLKRLLIEHSTVIA